MVYLTDELKAAIADQLARVKVLKRATGQVIPHLFPHLAGPYRGQRIKSLRKSWANACREAGCPGMLRHDLRRTAARNMINLGVSERVAMTVLGHKSTSMLHRYCIVSPGDLKDVARRLSDRTPTNGHINRAHGLIELSGMIDNSSVFAASGDG